MNPTPLEGKTGPLEGKAAGRRTKGAAVYSFPILVLPRPIWDFIKEHKRGVRDRTTLAAAHSLILTMGLSTGS